MGSTRGISPGIIAPTAHRLTAIPHPILGINRYNKKFKIDGTPASPQHRSLGLIAMNAVAALAADDPIRLEFVQAFWDSPLNTGQYRYYDNLLYMLALLHLSGQFRIYSPA